MSQAQIEITGRSTPASPGSPSMAPVGATPRRARKNSRFPYKWIAFVVIAIAAIWAYLGWRHHKAGLAAKIPAGDIATVDRGKVEKSVESAGKVISNLDVDIKCRASGEVVQLPFDVSQKVIKGQLVCQLDKTDELLAVQLAEASVKQAAAKLEQARDNYDTAKLNLQTTRMKEEAALASAKVKAGNLAAKADRQRQLVEQKLGSTEDFETAQTDAANARADQTSAEVAIEELKQQEIQLKYKDQDVKTAEAQLDADQITLNTQKQQLAYTTVNAPIDGTVSALDVQLGTIIASGTSGFSGGTTIMTLSDLSRMFVVATVDESDIGGVQVGHDARVIVDSYPNRTFSGKVVRIAVTGVNSSNVVTFEVKVEVNDKDKALLKPQMTGTVTIIEQSRDDVLMIPEAAVNHRAGKVFVQSPDGHELPVTLGVQGGETVEVVSGLKQGDKVLVQQAELPTRWKSQDGPR